MQSVQVSFPNQIPLAGRQQLPWRPAQPVHTGWRPAQPNMGQVSIGESVRVVSSIIVGLSAGVSGALLAFAGTQEKPRPVLRGIGWGVLGLGALVTIVNFVRVVAPAPAETTASN